MLIGKNMFIGSNLWKVHNSEGWKQANNNDDAISILSISILYTNYIYIKLENNLFLMT